MKWKNKIATAREVAAVRWRGKRIPIVVTWAIAGKCNYKCRYCQEWKRRGKELNTREAITIIDVLASLGTKRISFSGGEPLMRSDIGKLVDRAWEKEISSVITSNGSLVPAKLRELKNLALLKLSIDGSKRVQEALRGKGTFEKVIEAIKAAQKEKIKTVFNTVITRQNLGEVDFLLTLAEQFKTGVRFTVLSEVHADKDCISPLLPEAGEYRTVIDQLIKAKKAGRPVLNSWAGLGYYKTWPKPPEITCFAGRGFFHIGSEGKLFPCVMMAGAEKGGVDIGKGGVSEALKKLPELDCRGCWCGGTLELNLAMGLKELATLDNLRMLI